MALTLATAESAEDVRLPVPNRDPSERTSFNGAIACLTRVLETA